MTRPKLTIDGEKERAVSPVIGVILMVAITVILAAVIGTFVLDLGQNVQNTGPSASMGFSDAEEDFEPATLNTFQSFIVIEHQSGEPLDADSVRIVLRNVSTNAVITEWDQSRPAVNNQTGVKGNFTLNNANMVSGDTIQVGDTVTIELNITTANTVGDGTDYSVTVVSTDTDNRIATGTVEVQ